MRSARSRSADHTMSFALKGSLAVNGTLASRALRFRHIASVVRAANEWTRGHLFKTHALGESAEFFELVGGNVTHYRQVFGSGLQVLAERQEVAFVLSEIREALQQFVAGFTEPEHQAALGSNGGVGVLDMA